MFQPLQASVSGSLGFGAAKPVTAPARTFAADPPYRSSSLTSQELAAYVPGFLSGETASLYAKRLTLDRAQDLARNDPIAVAGIQRLVDMLVGAGLMLSARPDARAIGIPRKAARAIGQTIESEWNLFWNDPLFRADHRRKVSGNGVFRLGARTMAVAGEATAAMRWRKAGVSRYRTCIQAIDPDRLSNPYGQPDSPGMRGGVEFDDTGAATAYQITDAHPSDWWAGAKTASWTRIPRETAWGRPIFIHAYEPTREDQTRAVSPFAALVARLRMITRHADTEIAAAAVNALFAAFVTSSLSAADVAAGMAPGVALSPTRAAARNEYYAQSHPTIGGVRIPVLPIGDEIKINSSPRQTTAFPAFQTAFLQSIAAALGISYEQLSMDWSKTNYSSARAALNEVWRAIQRMLNVFVEQYVTPIYYCFLEEAIDRGYVAIPGGLDAFHEKPAAWTSARWIGPGRGFVDPETEAVAAQIRMGSLTSTLADEVAEQGKDLEEVLDQIEAEEEMLHERGLTRQTVTGAMPGQTTDQAGDPAKPREPKPGKPAGPSVSGQTAAQSAAGVSAHLTPGYRSGRGHELDDKDIPR